MNLQDQKGFIALLSAVIISAVLLLTITTTSLTGFYGRINVLESEYKERSSALADACADVIFLKLVNNSSYTGPETVPVGSDHCDIIASSGSNPRTFKIQASFQNSYTNLRINVDINSLAVLSWQEVPNLP